MCHVRVTFLLRSRGVSVTYLYSYGISLSYVRRIKAYVLRTRDVCMRVTYLRRMYYVPFLSASYLFCTNCFLIPVRTNGCVHFGHAIRTLQLSIIRGPRCHRRNLDNLD